MKALSVATSNRYAVGLPVLADQFAVNEVAPKDVAAEAVGIEGVLFTVKLAELVAVPPEVVTETVPVVPEPTVTVSTVPVLETMADTAVPPIVTLEVDTPERLVPFITRLLPAQMLDEPKLVIVGGEAATATMV